MDVNSGHAHLLTMADSVDAVVFDPSGQQLVVAHGSSICIIDTMSGTKLHETPFFDSSLKIEAMSWPEDKKQIEKASQAHRKNIDASRYKLASCDGSDVGTCF